MKRVLIVLSTLACLLPAVTGAADKLRVVATIPDLADMARQVGGDFVEVTSLATGVEDIHAVPMKPSFAVTLNHADVVLLVGLDAEHAFLPALLEASRNPKIQRDQPGYVDCSVYVTPLEVPSRIDRSLGDQHPMGNPHINLDPVLGKAMVRAIADGLARNDPAARRRLQAKRRGLQRQAGRCDRGLAEGSRASQREEARQLSPGPSLFCGALRYGAVRDDRAASGSGSDSVAHRRPRGADAPIPRRPGGARTDTIPRVSRKRSHNRPGPSSWSCR